jgi:hypothetical protein
MAPAMASSVNPVDDFAVTIAVCAGISQLYFFHD